MNDSRLAPTIPMYQQLRRRAPLLLGLSLLGAAIGLAAALVPPRRFPAKTVIAAASSLHGQNIPSGLSSLLAGAVPGFQATPYLVSRLLVLDGSLQAAAAETLSTRQCAVIDCLDPKRREGRAPQDVLRVMREAVVTDVDKQTGLITLAVASRDSAVNRRVARFLLERASAVYTRVSRQQAAEQRASVTDRISSATRRLGVAEGRLGAFQQSHRLFTAYAGAAVERQQLEREVQLAQDAYNEAIADRDGAAGRALEEPPMLVVVDSLPAALPGAPRHAAVLSFLGALCGLATALGYGAVRGDFAT